MGLFYPGKKGRAEQNAVGVPLTINGMALYHFDEDGLIPKLSDSGVTCRLDMGCCRRYVAQRLEPVWPVGRHSVFGCMVVTH